MRLPKRNVLLMIILAASLGFTSTVLAADDLWFDEDDLFGDGGLLLIEEPLESGGSAAEDLLIGKRFDVGGTYRLSLESSWRWLEGLDDAVQDEKAQLSGTIFMDARPSKDFRVFAKSNVNVGDGPEDFIRLTELFADFNVNNRIFFRGGKQTIHWGVGYFFSPADIINIGRIDPENPSAEREGPIALKANMPVGSDNYYMHLIADTSGSPVAIAPKGEWVVGGTEWGGGLYYRADRAPRGMVTFSSSWGKTSLFGEGVVSYGSDKRFVQEDAGAPFGVAAVSRDEEYFVHGTVGAHYALNDPEGRYNLFGAGQYYYNGEGYPKGFLQEHALGVGVLFKTGQLSDTDLMTPGRHYAALSLNWSKALGSRLSPGVFWLSNLEDASGMVTTTLDVDIWDKVGTSMGVSRVYGPQGSEYGAFGSVTTLFLRVGYSGSF